MPISEAEIEFKKCVNGSAELLSTSVAHYFFLRSTFYFAAIHPKLRLLRQVLQAFESVKTMSFIRTKDTSTEQQTHLKLCKEMFQPDNAKRCAEMTHRHHQDRSLTSDGDIS